MLRPILIVISLDGFRNSYFKSDVTPHLISFRKNGVYSDYLKTIYLPNALSTHHTIATGFYASRHGVIGHETFTGRDKLTWYGYNEELYNYNSSIIPIWLLNERNGGTSATMMWPGAEFPAGAERRKPTYHIKYNVSMPMEERFRQIINWLNRTRNQPNLIMVYINEPDSISHVLGPNNRRNLTRTLKRIDKMRMYLHHNILALHLSHRVNIVYLSDHGMWPVKPKNFKSLSTLENCLHYYKFIGRHTYLEMGRIYQYRFNLKCEETIRKTYGDVVFVNRDDYINRIEMNPDRMSNALLQSKKGDAWGDNMWPKVHEYRYKYGIPITNETEYGVHGYEDDNDAIFMAKGPLFVNYKKHPPFEMVDFYSLFAHILLVKGNFSHDGNFDRVSGLLQPPREPIDWTRPFHIVFMCCVAHIAILFIVINIFIYNEKNREKESKKMLDEEDIELMEIMRER